MQSSKSKRNIQWDKYMVYIIFAVVFVLFALILGNKGFLQPKEPDQYSQTDSHDFCYVCGRRVLLWQRDRSI